MADFPPEYVNAVKKFAEDIQSIFVQTNDPIERDARLEILKQQFFQTIGNNNITEYTDLLSYGTAKAWELIGEQHRQS